MLSLLHAPIQHSQIILLCYRRKVNQIRDVPQHGNILQPQMCHVIHAINRTQEGNNRRGIIVDAQILRNLVKGSLHKCAVHPIKRLAAVCRNAGCQCNRRFLRNANIHKLLPCFFAFALGKAHNPRCTGGNRNHGRVFFHLIQQILASNFFITFLAAGI